MDLKPFFSFYGGKWRAGPSYPAPEHDTIVEPFAGSAGYAVRHADRHVILYDADPIIAGVWHYLINVSGDEIRRLPAVVDCTDEVPAPQEARWLIGFWLAKATTSPRKRPTSWAKSGTQGHWGNVILDRIASQVEHIRHWKVHNRSYEAAENQRSTWFIDPPYSNRKGRYYRYHDVDFNHLRAWSMSRRGQSIVCGQDGETWMPFSPLGTFKAMGGKTGKSVTREAIWTARDAA